MGSVAVTSSVTHGRPADALENVLRTIRLMPLDADSGSSNSHAEAAMIGSQRAGINESKLFGQVAAAG